MRTLITIAGTLLAGATPFAASAALRHEAATTGSAQEAVVLRRVADLPAPDRQAQELEELRRAIAELRAEKDRLRAELDATRTEKEDPTETPEERRLRRLSSRSARITAPESTRKWIIEEPELDTTLEWQQGPYGPDAQLEWHAVQSKQALERIQRELSEQHAARGAYESALRAQAQEVILRAREDAVERSMAQVKARLGELQVERPFDEEGRRRLLTKLAELDTERAAKPRKTERSQVLVIRQGADGQIVELQDVQDHDARILIRSRTDDAAVEGLLQELGAKPGDSRSKAVEGRHEVFVIDGDEYRVESSDDGKRQRVFVQALRADDVEEPVTEPSEPEPVWIELDEESRVLRTQRDAPHSRTFIHDPKAPRQRFEVRSDKTIFVQSEDGEWIELEFQADLPQAPPAPSAPGARSTPSAPQAPTAPRADDEDDQSSTSRSSKRLQQLGDFEAPRAGSGSGRAVAPRAPQSSGAAGRQKSQSHADPSSTRASERDELLREVHVLTKEMLAELRLLRSAVDELRRDVDAHRTSDAIGDGGGGARRRP